MKKSITIGQYHLGKSIGQGTFGKVKLGTHTLSSEKVAIKVLQKKMLMQSNARKMHKLRREVGIWRRLTHPGIVQLHKVRVTVVTPVLDATKPVPLLASPS